MHLYAKCLYANGLATNSSLSVSQTTGKMTVKLLAAIYSDWSVNPACSGIFCIKLVLA